MYIKSVNDDEQYYDSSGLWASQILSLAREWISSAQKLQTKYKFKSCMYIKSVNDEQNYVSSGLSASQILSRNREWKFSAHTFAKQITSLRNICT